MPDISIIPPPDRQSSNFRYPPIDDAELLAAVLQGDGEDEFAKLQVDRFDSLNPGVFQAEARIKAGIVRVAAAEREIAKLRKQQDRTWRIRGIVTNEREFRIAGFHTALWQGLAILGTCGLVMGIQVGANNIVKSGNDAYAADWWGAVLFFGVALIVGARLKTFERQLPTDTARDIFSHVIAITGFAAFAVWVVTMASAFAIDTSGGVSALLSAASAGTGNNAGAVLVASHIITDVALGYGVFAGAEHLALGGHRIVVRYNPAHADIVAHRAALEEYVSTESDAVADAEDLLRRFDAARASVDYAARIAYRREAATRRHTLEAAVASANVALFSRSRAKATRAVAFWLLASLGLASSVNAKTSIVVLPRDYGGKREILLTHLADLALKLAPEDQLIVYSVHPPAQIATIAIPKDDRARNAAWLRRQLGEQFAPVVRDVATLQQIPIGGQVAENITMPEVLDEIGRNLIPSLPDKQADVLLIASPFYYDPRDARFGMTDGFYPSDGHLKASRAETPFGVAGIRNRMAGGTIHLCWPNSHEQFTTRAHEELIRRFWSLWVAEQSGKIGTISYDLATCFKRLRTSEASGQTAYTISPDSKVEMLRVRPPAPATLPASQDQPGAWFLRDDVVISKTPPTTTSGVAWIGLKWSVPCDVDLYARPDGTSQWLFYGNVRTEAGFFNKDHLTATGDSQFEFIEFVRPIDLTKAEAAINLYSGELRAPPEGVIRVWFGGNVYEAPFKIAATRGNRGSPPMSGANWVRIDLRKVVGLLP